jgi:hypothetical protein
LGDVLRDLAPEATKAGVILGLEDTISAEDNVRIMEESRSESVRVYDDVGTPQKPDSTRSKGSTGLGETGFANFI